MTAIDQFHEVIDAQFTLKYKLKTQLPTATELRDYLSTLELHNLFHWPRRQASHNKLHWQQQGLKGGELKSAQWKVIWFSTWRRSLRHRSTHNPNLFFPIIRRIVVFVPACHPQPFRRKIYLLHCLQFTTEFAYFSARLILWIYWQRSRSFHVASAEVVTDNNVCRWIKLWHFATKLRPRIKESLQSWLINFCLLIFKLMTPHNDAFSVD